MKHFLKIYFTTILLFICIGTVSAFGYIVFNRDAVVFPSLKEIVDTVKIDEDKNLTPLERAIKNSSRINILLVGKEHVRTDTIMLVSYDKEEKKANVLSIPRDTYYERENYDNRQQRKINAVYQTEGIEGLIDAVEHVTMMPIHKYVTVDYDAVVSIVDLLDGIEVNVPMNMRYSDPFDSPPLQIDIKAGVQTLDGETALKFLRFRQNSDGTGYPEGDIGRIKTQQDFIRVAVKKALGLKLPAVINEAFKHIDTNFTLTEMLGLATGLVGFSMDNLQTDIIDHYTKKMDNLDYVVPNEAGIKEYVYKLYNVEPEDTLNNGLIQIEDDTTEKNNNTEDDTKDE